MLSVSGRPKKEKIGGASHLLRGLILFSFLILAVLGQGSAFASGLEYGSYEENGAPELNKLVWNARAGTYGIWSAPSPYAAQAARMRRTEAGCEECAVATRAPRRRSSAEALGQASREIKKVASNRPVKKAAAPKKKAAKRSAEVEAEEESEYDAIAEESTQPEEKTSKSKATGKFVDQLLKNAYAEANRMKRMTTRGMKYKSTIGKSLGMCLQGVRMALQKTKGLSLNGGIGTQLAKNAGPHLGKFGYKKAGRGITQDNAPLGAIMIYDAPGQPSKAGHIEIKGKNGYYSDYFNSQPLNKLMPGRRRLIGIYLPPQN